MCVLPCGDPTYTAVFLHICEDRLTNVARRVGKVTEDLPDKPLGAFCVPCHQGHELDLVEKDQALGHVLVIVADRLVDDSGVVTGAHGFYVDITDGYEKDVQRTLNVVLEDITRARGVISQAIGMVRLVHDVSEERAFEVLRWLWSRTNTKSRDIAAQLVADAGARSIVPAAAKNDFDRLLLSAPRRIRCRR